MNVTEFTSKYGEVQIRDDIWDIVHRVGPSSPNGRQIGWRLVFRLKGEDTIEPVHSYDCRSPIGGYLPSGCGVGLRHFTEEDFQIAREVVEQYRQEGERLLAEQNEPF